MFGAKVAEVHPFQQAGSQQTCSCLTCQPVHEWCVNRPGRLFACRISESKCAAELLQCKNWQYLDTRMNTKGIQGGFHRKSTYFSHEIAKVLSVDRTRRFVFLEAVGGGAELRRRNTCFQKWLRKKDWKHDLSKCAFIWLLSLWWDPRILLSERQAEKNVGCFSQFDECTTLSKIVSVLVDLSNIFVTDLHVSHRNPFFRASECHFRTD